MAIFDTIIGLVFVYLLASLLATAMSELLEAMLRRRAKELWRAISRMLAEPDALKAVYTHPLVKALYKEEYSAASADNTLPTRALPSYIPAASFATALIEYVKAPANVEKPAAKAVGRVVADLTLAPDVVQKQIETWYDTTMDSVSTYYKSHVQAVLFVIGIVMAASMNINTMKVVRELATNTATRNAVVASATEFVRTHPEAPGTPAAPTPEALNKRITDLTSQIKDLRLPIGWEHWPKVMDASLQRIFWYLFGWFLTACAIALGAPFWFDLLNKFMSLRSAVKLPGMREKEQAQQ